MLSLMEKYNKEIAPEMMKEFGYKNYMAVPKIEKVVLNIGFGKMVSGKTSDEQKKIFNIILNDLSLICGQRPVITKSKKSIAAFKIREGMPLGAMVTLRGRKMYDFIEKMINVSLPRSRDFKGIDRKSFDESGNLTIAIKEDIIFPEIAPEDTKINFSFEATIATTGKKKEESIKLLELMGFPFKK